MRELNKTECTAIQRSALSQSRVVGLTHNFYRYPARFPPCFAHAVIEAFTEYGDIVFDPFMGGGTTIVEAKALGRHGVGTDISELATFVSQVKSTVLSEDDHLLVSDWFQDVLATVNLSKPIVRPIEWIERGYQRNISCKKTWPIRKTLEIILDKVGELPDTSQQKIARCTILKTSQWALDCRKEIPSSNAFRKKMLLDIADMLKGSREFSNAVNSSLENCSLPNIEAVCMNKSANGIEKDKTVRIMSAPKLILTSPPYPGVHMLYHRWQVQGRRETPAPFWIADCLDGSGETYYTMGGRSASGVSMYFLQIEGVFNSLAKLANRDTTVVQMIAFSEPDWQLPKYLQVMEQCGFIEMKYASLANASDGRLWRMVPNRKWYAEGTSSASGKEVVLFHQLAH